MEDLPVEVMADIMSRLPVKKIIHCKCVCKKWLKIVLDPYFADLQLSRSPAGIMVYYNDKEEKIGLLGPGILRWTEVEDELDHHRLHHDPVMSLNLKLSPIFQKSQLLPMGSVNGLLCLWQFGQGKDTTYICNPITREYMILPRQQYFSEGHEIIVYCFGVGLLTHEYKVIRIFQGDIHIEAEVYTLGTGQWRSLGHVPYRLIGIYGPFLNGHAHWIVADKDSPEKICAFDFDKETFELFPSPPSEAIGETRIIKSLGVLNGCLCRCEIYDNKLTIWVMKEYGIKKSWHKELVIEESVGPNLDLLTLKVVHIIEGLKDGTILMASNLDTLLVYCPRRKTIVDKERFDYYFLGYAYRPSFRRLQNIENERVHVF